MRGVPGSGKTSFVLNFLGSQFKNNYTVCSADDCPVYYDENHNYHWTIERCITAHSYCNRQFETAIERNSNLIILDNTNIQNKDFQAYVTKAKAAGYTVCYVEFPPDEAKLDEYAERNTHKVPRESILRMIKKWEIRK